jgi:hypothetical protein
MKKFKKGISISVPLDQVIVEGNVILLTIYGEDGNPINDNENYPIVNKQLTYDSITKKYLVELTINANTPEQYLRLYFDSINVDIAPEYQPEDACLIDNTVVLQELVPVQYFIDNIINVDSKMDIAYRKGFIQYINNNRTAIRDYLFAAQSQLETETQVYFTEREVTDEKRDYYFDSFRSNLWYYKTRYNPLTEFISFKLKFGENELIQISKEFFVVDKDAGTIEFLPSASGNTSSLYTFLLTNMTGLSYNILSGGILDRVPCLFHVHYKTGIIHSGSDPVEKNAVRLAVAQRALVQLLPLVDQAMRSASITEGLDGVSTSYNFNPEKVINFYKEEEAKFIKNIKQKYSQNIHMVIV